MDQISPGRVVIDSFFLFFRTRDSENSVQPLTHRRQGLCVSVASLAQPNTKRVRGIVGIFFLFFFLLTSQPWQKHHWLSPHTRTSGMCTAAVCKWRPAKLCGAHGRKRDRAVTPAGLHFPLIAWENRKLRSWKMQCLYEGHIYAVAPSTPTSPTPSPEPPLTHIHTPLLPNTLLLLFNFLIFLPTSCSLLIFSFDS